MGNIKFKNLLRVTLAAFIGAFLASCSAKTEDIAPSARAPSNPSGGSPGTSSSGSSSDVEADPIPEGLEAELEEFPRNGFAITLLSFDSDLVDTSNGEETFLSPASPSFVVEGRDSSTTLSLNGVDEYVYHDTDAPSDTLNPLKMASSNFSISIWFKTSANGGNQYILDQRADYSGTTRDYLSLYITAAGNVVGGFSTDWPETSNDNVITSATDGFNDGQWHHLVFSRTSVRQGILYVDGQVEGVDSDSAGNASGILPINTPTYLGRNHAGDSYFTGELDDFYWIKDVILTPTQIDEIGAL